MLQSCLWRVSRNSEPVRSLVQVCMQGEGEAKVPSFLAYKLTLVISATNQEDETVISRGTAKPTRELTTQESPSDTISLDPLRAAAKVIPVALIAVVDSDLRQIGW